MLTHISGSNVDKPKTSRQSNLAPKLVDGDNVQQAELSFQRKAVQGFRAQADHQTNPPAASEGSDAIPSMPLSTIDNVPIPSASAPSPAPQVKRTIADVVNSDDEDEIEASTQGKLPCHHVMPGH
jgi:hypothetical protein